MKNKNTSWFSLVIALLLTVVMILLALFILEYIIPYSKNVKWIENSSNAFYQTESAVENSLYFIKNRSTIGSETTKSMTTAAIWDAFDVFSLGGEIPAIIDSKQEGNSSFSWTFNTISSWNPIQLEIWDNSVNWNNVDFTFQTPRVWWVNHTLTWWTWAIINWQISGSSDTLNASGGLILANDINTGVSWNIFRDTELNSEGVDYAQWQILSWSWRSVKDFYTNNCGSWSWCVLKLSVINTLESTTWQTLPYLEYKINFNSSVPLRYSRIKASWKSYGFSKALEVRVPQQTTNQAFDFTVFQ